MGLFDGAGDDAETGSTAHVARVLDAPVVLVVDAASASRSVAAVVHGFATFDPRVEIAGVVVNRVASDSHERGLREALEGIGVPVVGVVRRDDELVWRSRHLGLVPVVEQPERVKASLDRLAAVMARSVDLERVLSVARRASAMPVPEPALPGWQGPARVAVASGPAFSFVYPDNLEALEAAGAELVPFDPRADTRLPEVDGLYVGGGFPEVFVEELGANVGLLADVRARVAGGLVTLAECGGLLWLARSLDGVPMAGALDAEAHMTDRLTLGYRVARLRTDTPLGPRGSVLRGHEFHYSRTDPAGDALELSGRTGRHLGGFGTPTMMASYVHLHFGGNTEPAERFVAAASKGARE